jgi:hypothetical protein
VPSSKSASASIVEPTDSSSISAPGSPASPVPQPEATAAGPLVGRYTADDPYSTADDLLGVDAEAAAFARLVAGREIQPPLAIGVFGEWGAGKTYFMRRVQSHIERLPKQHPDSPRSSPFLDNIVPIRFNAWHYIETNLWASLVEYIFSALDGWIQQQSGSDPCQTDLVFNRLATAQQLQIDALEGVVTRRSEQRNAEVRALRAREEYAAAVARSQQLRPNAYLRAWLETFLDQNEEAERDLKEISTELGLSELNHASERLSDALAEARNETGRGRLILRSMAAKIGTFGGIATLLAILLGIPVATTLFSEFVSNSKNWGWLKALHDTNVTWAAVVVALTGFVQRLRGSASRALDKLEKFDQRLQASLDRELDRTQRSATVRNAIDIEKELQKRKQAVESAERALAEANARLSAARRDFESGTARGRLNAFIRAKVVDGSYARHLGIIASIRKDFMQLASLIGSANQTGEEAGGRSKLRKEAQLRVRRFLNWLKDANDVRLTESEIQSLLVLLDPTDMGKIFAEFREVLREHFEGDEQHLEQIQQSLQTVSATPLPQFSRIVLYIDDLDRCPPEKVVDVLQAVHLLLCFPLFVVFVAVDARWVSRALHDRYPGLLADPLGLHGGSPPNAAGGAAPSSGASSHDYLEKIFQIPYWVLPMDGRVARSYVRRIADRDRARAAGPSSVGPAAAHPTVSGLAITPLQPALVSPDMSQTEASAGSTESPAVNSDVAGEAVGMTLSDAELELLETFAAEAGRTPRQAIRSINIYRVIKSSLPGTLRDEFDLERGTHAKSLALIPQLAIVTGAPRAASAYFDNLMSGDESRTLGQFLEALKGDSTFSSMPEAKVVTAVLGKLLDIEKQRAGIAKPITVTDMRFLAPTVRRYSFSAREERT